MYIYICTFETVTVSILDIRVAAYATRVYTCMMSDISYYVYTFILHTPVLAYVINIYCTTVIQCPVRFKFRSVPSYPRRKTSGSSVCSCFRTQTGRVSASLSESQCPAGIPLPSNFKRFHSRQTLFNIWVCKCQNAFPCI